MNAKTRATCLGALILLAACSHEVFYEYEGAKNVLFDIDKERAGENCAWGGQRLRIGPDINQDGHLSDSEVTSTEYVCDGADGDSGRVYVTDLGEGVVCPYGGQRIDIGVDSDGSGNLSGGEIERSHYICADARASGWSRVTSLSASGEFTCALLANQDVACWGLSADRTEQAVAPVVVEGLSKSTATSAGCALVYDGTVECWNGLADQPRRVPNLFTATAIAGNAATHACALLDDSTVQCWGDNSHGQLGNGSAGASQTPVPVFEASGRILRGAVHIAVGARHSCAVLQDGGTVCWGDNTSGQLGNGDLSVTSSGGALQVQGTMGTLSNVRKLALGDDHSCALLGDGTVQCWGQGESGRLGDETRLDPTAIASPVISGRNSLSGVTDLSSGSKSTCAIARGNAVCWGSNDRGQLGGLTRLDHSATPIQVSMADGSGALDNLQSIALGSRHACALKQNGEVYCWGRNRHGQMGNGQVMNFELYSARPVPFDAGQNAAITLGEMHGCMTRTDGSVACWGINDRGQSGSPKGNDWLSSPTPETVSGLPFAALAVFSGPTSAHSCALLEDTTAYCWGANSASQLGDQSTTLWKTPTQVIQTPATTETTDGEEVETPAVPLSGVTQMATGSTHTCAVLSDGTVKCWGQNANGQLGNGTTTASATPVTVTGTNGTYPMRSIAAGEHFTCGLTTSGAVRCWGRLNDSTTAVTKTSVAFISSSAGAIAVGARHFCAMNASSGVVFCWGNNANGQLGNGGTASSWTVNQRPQITNVISIAAGMRHTCAVVRETQGTSVYCWGNNAYGQLGDGTTTNRLTPVKVPGLYTAVSVTCGAAHTCATLADGSQRCWGWNSYSQLGTFPGQLGAIRGALFP